MEDQELLDIAVELAVAFDAPLERSEIVINEEPDVYPKISEKLFPKTKEEIAETEALVPYAAGNGLLLDRPLSYIEILEKLNELGYSIVLREE